MKKLATICIMLFISACAEESINEPDNSTANVSVPTNLETTYISSEYVDLIWNDNSANENQFVIEYRSQSNPWTIAGVVPQNTTEYRVNDLNDGSEYYFRVQAKNQNNESKFSDSILVTTLKKLQPFKSEYMLETTDSLEMRLSGSKQGISVINRYYDNGMFVVEEYTDVPPLNFEETIITKMHSETYNLISFEESLTQNSRTKLTTAVWDSSAVSVQSGSDQYQRNLDSGTVERTSFFYILNALPLAVGFTHILKMYFVQQNIIWDVNLVVEGIENVSVPAGEFEAYHVVLKGTQPELHIYIATSNRRLVRMEIPTQGWEYLLLNK